MKPGRNDPCPCGSGRKYKSCCLRAAADPAGDSDLHWRRVRRSIEPLGREMVREAKRHFGETGLEEAWSEFFAFDASDTFDPQSRFVPMFFSWYLHDWLPDPHGTQVPVAVREISVAEAYLGRVGHRLDRIARAYVEGCIATPHSFHEVLRSNPGVGFRLRDVMLGTEADVSERTASKIAKVGDCLFGKVVPVDGLTMLDGVAPVAIPPAYKSELIDLRKMLAEQANPLDAEVLREYADELRELYLDIDTALHRRPELRNTDGDPLEMYTLHFELDAPETALEQLADLGRGIDAAEVERDEAGALRRADIMWTRDGSAVHEDRDNTVLGTLRIEGTHLSADVNSVRRAARLRALIERRLGDTAHVQPSVVQSVPSLLDRAPPPGARREQERADLAAMPEIAAVMQDMMRSHYRRWVDETLPALGNRTPRNAVRDPGGRAAVDALIAQIERGATLMNPPLDPAIIDELRTTLGLR